MDEEIKKETNELSEDTEKTAEDAALNEELENLRETFQEQYDATVKEAEEGSDEAEKTAGESDEAASSEDDAENDGKEEKIPDVVDVIKDKLDGEVSFRLSKKLLAVIIAALIVVIAVVTGICISHATRTAATKNVISMIDSIGDVGTSSDGILDEINEAYFNLTEKEQKRVSNYSKYTKAKEEYEEIVDFNAKVTEVYDSFVKPYSSQLIDYSALIEQANEVLKEYGKMSKSRKAKVTSEIEDIEGTIDLYNLYIENANEAAKVYVDKFLETYAAKNYQIADLGCIMYISNGDQRMLFAIETTTGDKFYSHVSVRDADSLSSADESVAEYFFLEKPVSEDRDPLTNRNITLDYKAILGDDFELPATTTAETTAPETTEAE